MIKRLLLALALLAPHPSQAQTTAGTTNSSAVIAAGNTFQTLLAALTAFQQRRSLTIQNNNVNTDNCWIFVGGGSATKATSILLLPGGAFTRYYPYIPSDAIQGTCATTNDTIYVDVQ